MTTCILSANYGHIDHMHNWEPQGEETHFYRLTENFRPKALSDRCTARLIKTFGWDMFDTYDYYIWVDGSYILKSGAKDYLISEIGDNDIAVFLHPEVSRNSIKAEYEFMRDQNSKYLHCRYDGEQLEEQYTAIVNDKDFVDDGMFHTAIYIYRVNDRTKAMFKEWWFNITRYHINDQLSFPYALKKAKCLVKVIDKRISEVPYFQYVRHRRMR